MKIRKGDNVIVTVGKDKGKKGTVEKVFTSLDKVLISGVNMKKVHKKREGKGEVIDKSFPISVSNVMILDPKGGKPTRIGFKVEDGKKIRIARKSGQKI
ncbi:50S ribosomal protein L24 [Candidatus Nomurabacteria bacterium]|nr:50S ribosomal protein L24 [Candidatus Nomurabacteria bacterium]USN94782.1 MAG: 50S ribosomal protein L24 [Candidatus Nomurabacteria bacterium]